MGIFLKRRSWVESNGGKPQGNHLKSVALFSWKAAGLCRHMNRSTKAPPKSAASKSITRLKGYAGLQLSLIRQKKNKTSVTSFCGQINKVRNLK